MLRSVISIIGTIVGGHGNHHDYDDHNNEEYFDGHSDDYHDHSDGTSHDYDSHHLAQPRSASPPSYAYPIDTIDTPNPNHSSTGYHLGDTIIISQRNSEYSLKIVDQPKWDVGQSEWIYHVKSEDGYFDKWIPASQVKGYAT